MRFDRDYAIFASHFDWYKFIPGTGFVPTEKAPDYAIEAMRRWNEKQKIDLKE